MTIKNCIMFNSIGYFKRGKKYFKQVFEDGKGWIVSDSNYDEYRSIFEKLKSIGLV